MKITHKDLKKGEIKVLVQNLDDLWYLSHIIEPGDLISGKTLRKIKVGSSENAKTIRKPVYITIKTEKIELGKTTNTLKILGTVTEGTEDVPNGTHHSFNVEEGTQIKIIKQEWLKYQLDKIQEACKDKAKTIILVLDRETATFALLKNYGYEVLADMTGEVQKKGEEEKKNYNFYQEIIKMLQDYIDRYKADNVLVASPGFWKDEFKKQLPEDFTKKIFYATCNNTGKNGVNEVLKREEVKTVLKEDRVAQETQTVELLLKEISTGNLAVYGIQETKKAIEMGAVKTLLITDEFIRSEEQDYKQTDKIMKMTEKLGGEVLIISSEHEAGRKLNGLGGIGAILRYQIQYE